MPQLTIRGGKPLREKPFNQWPVQAPKTIENLRKVTESDNWAGNGPFETRFSEDFARFQGGEFGLCVSSGMAALFIALEVLEVKRDDEVIVPAYTMPTPLAVCYHHANPVFVDIDPSNLCIDPQKIREALSPKTKAIIIIHNHNTMADMDEIMKISREFSIPVIEDCAHAHGMKWNGKGAGYIGDIGIFSFQNTKPMTAGEGGFITTKNRDHYEKACAIRNMGKDSQKKDRNDVIGWNLRITEFQAAILSAQLEVFPQQIQKKRDNMAYFENELKQVEGISPIVHKSQVENATGFLFSLFYDKVKFGDLPMSILAEALMAEGLPIRRRGVSYSSPSIQSYLGEKGIEPDCPIAEKYANEIVLTIPHQVFLGEREDINDMIQIFRKVQENTKELNRFKWVDLARKIKQKIGVGG